MKKSTRKVNKKSWAYVEDDWLWSNGHENIAIYSDKKSAEKYATPNMKEKGKLVECEITYFIP